MISRTFNGGVDLISLGTDELANLVGSGPAVKLSGSPSTVPNERDEPKEAGKPEDREP